MASNKRFPEFTSEQIKAKRAKTVPKNTQKKTTKSGTKCSGII